MPAPMLHLSVAKQVLNNTEIKCHDSFYLGCISPDAIHARTDSDRPDKSITHFNYNKGDKASWLGEVKAFLESETSDYSHSFKIGYAAHILTDICWLHEIFFQTRDRIRTDKTPILDETRAYYNDLVLIDYAEYLNSPWKDDIFELLENADAPDSFPLLTQEEIDSWRKTSIEWFGTDKRIGKMPLRYMRTEEIAQFVKNASLFVTEELKPFV